MVDTRKIHFEISERKILLRIFDVVFVLGSLYAVGFIFDFDYFIINSQHWVWSIILSFYLLVFATIFELYNLQKNHERPRVFKNIVLTTSATVFFYLLTPFYTPALPGNRLQIIYFYLAVLVALSLWRYLYMKLIATPRFSKKVLIVGDSFDILKIIEDLKAADPNFNVVAYVNTKETEQINFLPEAAMPSISLDCMEEFVKQYHIGEIIVCSSYKTGINGNLYAALIRLLRKGYTIKEYSQVYEEFKERIPITYLERDFYKYFPFSRSNQNKLYLFLQRVLDVLCSVVGIILGSLFLPLVIIGNAIGNRGPLFYTQERVGQNGCNFKILKLRTMVINAERNGAQWSQNNDTRITKFGKFLRKSRLDEIPQFYNVLVGDMSFIGPRPERPVFVTELAKVIPFYDIRHVIKPGLTGWAQVSTSYGSSEEDSLRKLQYDLYYIKHRGPFLDLRIFIKTLSTVIFFRGQ
ncbi:sugar transferase [Haloflavibacter putidus]|uniref:Sugar transferase n=1 Tax=Haloflavibacter putidus TaxID=2576776 RepID=A0A507ZM69_9FLAO|nr:sugar transferase [Haloflavibacter putidus]TQD38600.1 sugar transferase [Haloflavibacter putidus]